MRVRTALILSCLLAASCKHAETNASASTAATPPLGLSAFTRSAQVETAKLSPKGTFVATLSEEGGKRSLAFVKLATHELTFVLKPKGESTIGRFHWANDERVVIEMLDHAGDLAAPVSRGKLYAVDAMGRSERPVFGHRTGERQVGSHIRKPSPKAAWGFLISTLRNDPRKVLIARTSMWGVGDRVADVYKLDVYTGLKTHVARGPLAGASFLTDEDGELRIAAGIDESMTPRYFLFDGAAGWRELRRIRGFSSQSRPIGFISRESALYVSEPVSDGFAVYLVSMETGERKLVARSETPVSGTVEDGSTGRIVALEYEPDLPTYQFLDAAHPLSRALRALLAASPNEHVRIVNTTDDDRKALVRVYSDRDPGRFLLVDVGTLSAETVAEARPWVKPEAMAEMSAFHVPASDGFGIHGYITLPPKAQPGALPPMVVLPHGGPHWVRDYWGFNPEVQLLAEEGFAVLQVNYRGSGGYGAAYQEAGYRKWGDRIIEDIIDATRFAVRKGFADPKRICIYGGSFGAYAALQGAILAPDLYRCAAGYDGIYDLLRTALGEDRSALDNASPARHPDQISAPVFLIHGRKDQRAPIEHAEALRDALAACGKPPEWLVESKEGHGFFDDGARERMYGRLVKFFKENTRPAATSSR